MALAGHLGTFAAATCSATRGFFSAFPPWSSALRFLAFAAPTVTGSVSRHLFQMWNLRLQRVQAGICFLLSTKACETPTWAAVKEVLRIRWTVPVSYLWLSLEVRGVCFVLVEGVWASLSLAALTLLPRRPIRFFLFSVSFPRPSVAGGPLLYDLGKWFISSERWPGRCSLASRSSSSATGLLECNE